MVQVWVRPRVRSEASARAAAALSSGAGPCPARTDARTARTSSCRRAAHRIRASRRDRARSASATPRRASARVLSSRSVDVRTAPTVTIATTASPRVNAVCSSTALGSPGSTSSEEGPEPVRTRPWASVRRTAGAAAPHRRQPAAQAATASGRTWPTTATVPPSVAAAARPAPRAPVGPPPGGPASGAVRVHASVTAHIARWAATGCRPVRSVRQARATTTPYPMSSCAGHHQGTGPASRAVSVSAGSTRTSARSRSRASSRPSSRAVTDGRRSRR